MFIVQERVRGGDFYFRNVLSSPSAANSYEGLYYYIFQELGCIVQ